MEKLKLFFTHLRQSFETKIRILIFAKYKRTLFPQDKKTLIVLGNGPSLNPSLEELGDVVFKHPRICVNFFPATDSFEKLKPEYFVTSAPELWRDGVDEYFLGFREKVFRGLAEKTQWPLELFIAWEAKKFPFWQEIISKNKRIKITYYNILPVEGYRWFRHFLFNRRLGLPRPHNVLVPSMMMAMHKNFKQIILLGADHTWLGNLRVDDENRVLMNEKHFYQESYSGPIVIRKAGKGVRRLHEILQKYQYTFESYFIIKEYAATHNVQVLNATPGSFIDAFDRINTADLKAMLDK